MSILAPERADVVVRSWLELDGGAGSPAGPLFSGKYAEYEITMTGGGGGVIASHTNTGCAMCTGSICQGQPYDCW